MSKVGERHVMPTNANPANANPANANPANVGRAKAESAAQPAPVDTPPADTVSAEEHERAQRDAVRGFVAQSAVEVPAGDANLCADAQRTRLQLALSSRPRRQPT